MSVFEAVLVVAVAWLLATNLAKKRRIRALRRGQRVDIMTGYSIALYEEGYPKPTIVKRAKKMHDEKLCR